MSKGYFTVRNVDFLFPQSDVKKMRVKNTHEDRTLWCDDVLRVDRTWKSALFGLPFS